MMKEEFEELSGVRVGRLFHDVMIEQMYLSLPEFISKQEFSKIINTEQAQNLYYKHMISTGALGTLYAETMADLFADLEYLGIVDKAFPDNFIYTDTDSIKSFRGGFTQAKAVSEAWNKAVAERAKSVLNYDFGETKEKSE